MSTALLQLQCLVKAAPSSQPVHTPQMRLKMCFTAASMDAGAASMDAGPSSTDAGAASMDAGPSSADAGPSSMDAGAASMDAHCRALAFWKKTLQTCQSSELHTAKCLTTPVQEKSSNRCCGKSQCDRGALMFPLPRRCSRRRAGLCWDAAEGLVRPGDDLQHCAQIPRDQKPTSGHCHVLLVPLHMVFRLQASQFDFIRLECWELRFKEQFNSCNFFS